MASRLAHKRLRGRIWNARYMRKLIAMGFPGGRVPSSYLIMRRVSGEWNRTHHDKMLAAGRRYDRKLARICGTHYRGDPRVRVYLDKQARIKAAWRKEIATNGYCSLAKFRRLQH